MSGAVLEFSAADLAATAAAYDPTKHEAPIVVGHPKIDGPAYGWVKSLHAVPDLEAEPHQVDAAFAEMVTAGRFKKVSASFFPPDHPSNPVPGVWYLRHIGFLGAQPPAVKGLRTPSFGAADDGIVEFGDWDDETNAGLWRRLRDWILAKFGQDEADRAIPPYEVGSLERSAAQPEADRAAISLAPAFADPSTEEAQVTPAEKAALEAENAQLKQQLDAVTARDKAAAATTRHAAHAAFAETLAAEGKLLPAQAEIAIAMLDFAASGEAVEFGEGDQKKPLAEAFKDFLGGLPKQVDFGEHATRGKAGADGATVDFAAPAGFGVDGDSATLHRKALAHQAQHATDYLTAVRAVSL